MSEATHTVVTDRPDETESPVIPVFLQPVQIILIRAARTYLQSLLGMLTAMVGTQIIPYTDFTDLFVKAASLAVAPMAFSLLQNTLELLAKLDKNSPTLRA